MTKFFRVFYDVVLPKEKPKEWDKFLDNLERLVKESFDGNHDFKVLSAKTKYRDYERLTQTESLLINLEVLVTEEFEGDPKYFDKDILMYALEGAGGFNFSIEGIDFSLNCIEGG